MARKARNERKRATQADRQKVASLRLEGYTPTQIVRLTGLQKQFVYRWISRAHDYGNIESRPKGHPEKKLTSDVIDKVRREMKGKREKSCRKVSQALKNRGINIGRESVRKAAHATGMKPHHRPRKPALTKEQKKARVKFAIDNKDRDWSKVLFVDEKAFHIMSIPNRKNDVVWTDTIEEVPIAPTTHMTSKINVFGAISKNGKSKLHIFENNLTGEYYKTILGATLLPSAQELYPNNDWALIQDNDPKHKSHVAQDYVAEEVPECIEFPPSSPDLNVIENVWSMMGEDVAKTASTNLKSLKRSVKRAWDNLITQQYIDSLIASMPKRLKAIIKNKGDPLKY